MSLRTVLDFQIHVESFRNIDLFVQSMYQLKFQLYYMAPNSKVPQTPSSPPIRRSSPSPTS